ncbi:chorismate mutase [Mycolicibacterium canariasense]|nr:chorismate mutase [Mycolicibacterium canariasense]
MESEQVRREPTVLRQEIDALDEEILRLIQRRVEVSRRVGRSRRDAGGPRIVYQRELEIIARYRTRLGREGNALAAILLRLGRGPLGQPNWDAGTA